VEEEVEKKQRGRCDGRIARGRTACERKMQSRGTVNDGGGEELLAERCGAAGKKLETRFRHYPVDEFQERGKIAAN